LDKDLKTDSRWALFGPYIGQFVLFQSETTAFIQTDELTSKLTRAVLMTSGTKIIRGWSEAENVKGKQPKKVSKENITEEKKEEELPQVVEPSLDETKTAFREIKHLAFVIHGYRCIT
jgi:hypothetical protein